jgi:hypothetical protein
MAHDTRPPFEPIPLTMAALVSLTLPLPLGWWTLGAAAVALAILLFASFRRARPSVLNLTTAATIALSTVGAIVLAYAAYALIRVGVFGPVGRLGYPFLVATGLRLEGGAWLVVLSGLVSIVPIVFAQHQDRKAREDHDC